MKRKIAIISHSSRRGGAEKAALNLLKLMKSIGFEVFVIFPDSIGPLFKEALDMGVTPYTCAMTRMLGDPVIACHNLANGSYHPMKALLQKLSVELVISNTLSVFDGALAAAELGLHHIWNIHEIVDDSPEYAGGAIAGGTYTNWAAGLSDLLIFCSESTRSHNLNENTRAINSLAFPPYIEESTKLKSLKKGKTISTDTDINLYFIGSVVERKNPYKAIEILKALNMRGANAKLHFIGSIDSGPEQDKLERLIRRRKLTNSVYYLGFLPDPYAYFKEKSINLICATCEPFGLSIPECLSRGIPVVAPNNYGPKEILDQECQYEPDNIAECVRIIERISSNYSKAQKLAFENYTAHSHKFDFDHQKTLLQNTVNNILSEAPRLKSIPDGLSGAIYYASLHHNCLDLTSMITAISRATGQDISKVSTEIEREKGSLGQAVKADIKRFDVIPFHYSKEMDELYSKGTGFSIELAAGSNDFARIKMAGFILLRLLTEREKRRLDTGMHVLALGDGIGTDSIRLASAGFNVDYMDFGFSVTSNVATELFSEYNRNRQSHSGQISIIDGNFAKKDHYDAVIALEVIEHVKNPLEFLEFISNCLKLDGLAFISDCFQGIEDYYPTHLADNEKLAGMLPMLAAIKGLKLNGYSKAPKYKPYVFLKTGDTPEKIMSETLVSQSIISMTIEEQCKIIPKKKNMVESIFERLTYFKKILLKHIYRIH